MPSLISFTGTHQNKFLLDSNRTNSWWIAHMYFLTCFPPWYVVSKKGISTIRYFFISICFQMFLSWHWTIFCTLFWCKIRKTHILKIYIYFPSINTQQQSTEPFNNTPVISHQHIKHSKTGLYEGLYDCFEVDRESDLKHIASVILRQYNTITNQY